MSEDRKERLKAEAFSNISCTAYPRLLNKGCNVRTPDCGVLLCIGCVAVSNASNEKETRRGPHYSSVFLINKDMP